MDHFDATSLRSYPSTVALDNFPPSDAPSPWRTSTSSASISEEESREVRRRRPSEILLGFPRPPSRAHITTKALVSRPSVKTLRRNYMIHELPLLHQPNPYYDESDEFNPVCDPGLSYDLIAPQHDTQEAPPLHALEKIADLVFSSEHMLTILHNPRYLAKFREFLLEERPRSLHRLIYYLTARKALKAIDYANCLVRCFVDDAQPKSSVSALSGQKIGEITHPALQQRVQEALKMLTDEELPAFITSRCIGITSRVVEERVRGTLPKRFQRTDDEKALAEVFCLTDPSRRDNPIVFASEEFHRTTQYGMDYVLGRNCRFLQGPKTNSNSVRRIREALEAGRHHSELFLNYRRDGSPFMNLLQCAPLCDSHGRVRYFIGAQIDVSGLVMDGVQMESLRDLQKQQMRDGVEVAEAPIGIQRDEFRDLSELFSPRELKVTQDIGGSLFQPMTSPALRNSFRTRWSVAEGEESVEADGIREKDTKMGTALVGVYENYLLVRPYPSLRILFTSPSLQIPGILQSSFLSRIGSSAAIRDELLHALMSGRSVTARIKWLNRFNAQGRDRWVHCTPLLASNGEVGVWMVVVVDDDE
ncbi:white collar [Aspergillus costaricaensis CBS 115574]|uniref:White collar n=1 Tax=Aspergillus costaricaensis CBS 115574 TaxID=1448317 RepID=A0ACD1IWA2_9EURO|nr:white collar [Aspergillus costaricaensis CBS 115574]RAK94062.1 white collar [Aspergillus costaricaensis CBS 115574]